MVADPPAPTPPEMTGGVKAKDSDLVLFLPVTGSRRTRDPVLDKET